MRGIGAPILHKFHQINESDDSIKAMSHEDMVSEIIKYASSQHVVAQINRIERGDLERDVFAAEMKNYIMSHFNVKIQETDNVFNDFVRFLWGYYIIDVLIDDENISDIRIIDFDQIYYKKLGKRYRSQLSFRDRSDYERFIERVVIKNHVNASYRNAVQVFTDISNSDWIMRLNLSTGFVMSGSVPMLHIRKHPRKKKLLENLVKENMLDEATKDLLIDKVMSGESFFLCGAGGSGKTTLMNALIEVIPDSWSIFCVQEAEELFSMKKREFCGCHTVANRGEGKVSYGLEELATNGLLVDTDVYIIGEIKGDEARDFLTAAYTGAVCYGSGHANSVRDAFVRLADMVKRRSDYTVEEILYMLKDINNIIFMKDYRVSEVAHVSWNADRKDIEYDTLFLREGGIG